MFGIESKDLDFFTCLIIGIFVIITICFIHKSLSYSNSLLEGFENNNKDALSFNKLRNLNVTKTTVTDLENMINTFKSDLKLNECSGSDSNKSLYEDILINLEEFCDILIFSKTIKLTDDMKKDNQSELFNLRTKEINELQKFKDNLNNVYTWMNENTSNRINCKK